MGELSRKVQPSQVLPHIKFRSAAIGFVELGLSDVVSDVLGARVGDSWAFNAQLDLDYFAEVLQKKSTGPLSSYVVTMVFQVDEELLFLRGREVYSRFRGLLGGLTIARLNGLASFEKEGLEDLLIPTTLDEASEKQGDEVDVVFAMGAFLQNRNSKLVIPFYFYILH